ncbi:MAG: hypothetical protein K6G75_04035 [Lachnospiraceae bacterium]|nr:hypothetical protein [Lachnospiraceae bacterium]
MRKIFIIIVNIIIMAAILSFVVLYSGFASRNSYQRDRKLREYHGHHGTGHGKLS